MTNALHRLASETLHLGPEPFIALLRTGLDVLAVDELGRTVLDVAQERYAQTHGKGGLGRELAPLIGGDRAQDALEAIERATLNAVADRTASTPSTGSRKRL
ncbi:hypothetical protein SAMN05216466_106101 [Paraburkholderia phenazinium]|uniref:Uncharacterized protein n=1 Tax=Paraburkholderia phenazinium TaxID=60549 RepID=A0A1G7YAD1_9BURK|nr:hypothetical protein [Paraburkholderia phenazinium]SDG93296.1 hypothetical protein SAMN05216466_106101 [Paraburkholderia phenazinium]